MWGRMRTGDGGCVKRADINVKLQSPLARFLRSIHEVCMPPCNVLLPNLQVSLCRRHLHSACRLPAPPSCRQQQCMHAFAEQCAAPSFSPLWLVS